MTGIEALRVFKFGGTSVGSAQTMRAVAKLVAAQLLQGPMILVASAMSTVTDRLVHANQAAAQGDFDAVDDCLKTIRSLHHRTIDSLATAELATEKKREIDELLGQALRILRATAFLRELTPRARDAVLSVGEKLSVRVLAIALDDAGVPVEVIDADTFLDTDARFGDANPIGGVGERTIISKLTPNAVAGKVSLVTGFCGRAPDGSTTTMGRGGSDLTATTIGAAMTAKHVTLWSDVDGVFTANPKLVPDARPIGHLNFREAAEMSFYGAQVIHQRSMMPVAEKGISVYSRNTFNPDAEGTLIDGTFTLGSHPVKAVTAVEGQRLLSIEGKGMAGVPGIAARVFGVLAQADINVTMISQSSSEASITFAVQDQSARRAQSELNLALSSEFARGLIEEVSLSEPVGLVAAVGLGMARQSGISGRVFATAAAHHINVLAIAQGASELNISFAVNQADTRKTVIALHEEFALGQIDSGVDVGRHFDLLLLGCGQIGRRVLQLLRPRLEHIQARYDLTTRVVAIADRSSYLIEPTGLSQTQVDTVLDTKTQGRSLSTLDGAQVGDAKAMLTEALGYRLARPVFVDVSNDDAAGAVFEHAFALGTDIVTANKAPLSGTLADYERVVAPANQDRLLRAESTVGAGLPVLDTIQLLRATGDKVLSIQGCLSGTLGFIADALESGSALSDAVEQAMGKGFTEPDPALDLSGADVGRKALILARISGIAREAEAPDIEGFVPASWIGLEVDELMSKIKTLDEIFAFRVAQATAAGECLRFVATVEPGMIDVGLKSVPKSSPLGSLTGTDNMVVFHTERYRAQPLVVSGPGAGADVTAMGVLGDIIRIAMERA
jgi:bifunctional aspartokinase / homoserine dehydrogenase 1